jgi:hypothetical protein
MGAFSGLIILNFWFFFFFFFCRLCFFIHNLYAGSGSFGRSLSIILCIFLFYEEHGCNRGGREIQILRRWASAVVAGQDLCAWMSSIRLGVPCLVSGLLRILVL